MQKIRGRLLYSERFRSWGFLQDHGEMIDLRPIIEKFLMSINDRRVRHKLECDGIYCMQVIGRDTSDFFCNLGSSLVALKHKNNSVAIGAYAEFDRVFCRFADQIIEIEIEDGKQLVITPR